MVPNQNTQGGDQPTELAQRKPVELVHAIDTASAAVSRLDLLSSLVAFSADGIDLSQMDGLASELMSISADVKQLLELL